VCSTSAATVEKALSTDDDFELTKGAVLFVRFSATNSAASPTFNVNKTGAYAVKYRGSTISASYLAANRTYPFIFTGTAWEMGVDRDTTYSNVSLGGGLATCSDAAETKALTASLGSYSLSANGRVSVRFVNNVSAGATLNINNKGAKAIYYQNAAIKDDVIKAGTTATFIYSTYYHLVAMDTPAQSSLDFLSNEDFVNACLD
jgi:hypothetical protein